MSNVENRWTVPWYSSFESDLNYDFHVTMDEAVAPVEYNYRDKVELLRKGETYFTQGESHGLSAFLRGGDGVFHTYSTYARGTDLLAGTYNYLDLTALGRQEDWEAPPGRSDGPFMHWLRHHDRYENRAEIPAAAREKSSRERDAVQRNQSRARAGTKETTMTIRNNAASEDIAFCRSFNRITGTRTDDEKTDVWVRATVCCRKLDGQWKIVHEHQSVPSYLYGR